MAAMVAPLALLTPQISPAAAQPGPAAVPPPVKIMPLGDSITWGAFSSKQHGYRKDLYERLHAAGVNADFVGSGRNGDSVDPDNEGHRGWRIDQIRAEIDGWMAAYTPDIVLLHIGTNDNNRNDRAGTAHARLAALVDQILSASPDVRVVVSQVAPARNRIVHARVAAYNAKIPAVVKARAPRVTMTSMAGLNPRSDFADALHPNDRGYRMMSYRWYRALEPLLNTTGTRWAEGYNPWTAKYVCTPPTRTRAAENCRWFYLRHVPGKPTAERQWQTRRTVRQPYRVMNNPPRTVTRTRQAITRSGRHVTINQRVRVPATYQTRYRLVTIWSS